MAFELPQALPFDGCMLIQTGCINPLNGSNWLQTNQGDWKKTKNFSNKVQVGGKKGISLYDISTIPPVEVVRARLHQETVEEPEYAGDYIALLAWETRALNRKLDWIEVLIWKLEFYTSSDSSCVYHLYQNVFKN